MHPSRFNLHTHHKSLKPFSFHKPSVRVCLRLQNRSVTSGMPIDLALILSGSELEERRDMLYLCRARTVAGNEAKGLVIAVEGLASAVSECDHVCFGRPRGIGASDLDYRMGCGYSLPEFVLSFVQRHRYD